MRALKYQYRDFTVQLYDLVQGRILFETTHRFSKRIYPGGGMVISPVKAIIFPKSAQVHEVYCLEIRVLEPGTRTLIFVQPVNYTLQPDDTMSWGGK